MKPGGDHYVPVIVVGAPRSGTNMLRDLLTKLPGCGTWPCDEINAIWRHGSWRRSTDELQESDANPRVKDYIRSRFRHLAERRNLRTVIEKTCANSLRIEFVNSIFPEARYILLIRDGRDAASSAMRRWKAPVDLAYVGRKACWVPITDLPRYGLGFLRNRVGRLANPDRHVPLWGPVFAGLAEIVQSEGLAAACGAQWARCVDRAEQGLAQIDSDRVFRVRYEELVGQPARFLGELSDYLETPLPAESIHSFVAHVTTSNVGKWREQLDRSDLDAIVSHAGEALRRHGYGD